MNKLANIERSTVFAMPRHGADKMFNCLTSDTIKLYSKGFKNMVFMQNNILYRVLRSSYNIVMYQKFENNNF